MDSLAQPKLRKMDMIFGTRKVWRISRAGSMITVAREVAKYKLDILGL